MPKGYRKQKRAEKLQRETKETRTIESSLPEQWYYNASNRLIGYVLQNPKTYEVINRSIDLSDFWLPIDRTTWQHLSYFSQRWIDKGVDVQEIVNSIMRVTIFSSKSNEQEYRETLIKWFNIWVKKDPELDPEHIDSVVRNFKTSSSRLKIVDACKKLLEVNDNAAHADFFKTFNELFDRSKFPDAHVVVIQYPQPARDIESIERYREAYIQSLKNLPYADYLKTEHWKRIRTGALDRAKNRCQTCNTSIGLHVHHRTYENRGDEQPEDVTVLCATCHKLFHENRKLEAA